MTLTVGMVTCWYKNISMANYAQSLIAGLEKYPFIKVKVVTSPCSCGHERLSRSGDNWQSQNCEFVTFPPYIDIRPKGTIGRILNGVVQASSHFVRGMVYLSKCKSCGIVHYQQSAFSLGILPLVPIMLIPTANKKIVTAHTLPDGAGLRILKITYNRADRIIVHSREMFATLTSLGVDASKIEIVAHGTKIPNLVPCRREKVTFFGAPVKEKGAFLLLDALRILKERGEKTIVHFYGICSDSERKSLDAGALRLRVDDCVVWGGRLSEDEFDRKMQESMFTFAIYLTSVSGSSILTRAMANGTPVIATNLGGAPEYSQNLVLVPPNDSRAVADAISKLSRDATLRRELGEAARTDALRISWDVVARRNLGVYLNTLMH